MGIVLGLVALVIFVFAVVLPIVAIARTARISDCCGE